MDKRSFSEWDICRKFITSALRQAGWDKMLQIGEEASFTQGRIIVWEELTSRMCALTSAQFHQLGDE